MNIKKQKETLITGLTIQLDRKEYESLCRTCKKASEYANLDAMPQSVKDDLAGSFITFLNKTVGELVLYPTLNLKRHKITVKCRTTADEDVLNKILIRFNNGVANITPTQSGPYEYDLGVFVYKDTEDLRLELSKRGLEFKSVPVYEGN